MKDTRVQSAISHWLPRFVSNGVLLADFEEVTASLERWEDWCEAWSRRAEMHGKLGQAAFKEGYKLTGKLDMHGKSKEITMPAKITQTGKSLKLESTFKINRFDWDVNYGKGKVDDNVEIKVKLDGKAK